MKYILVFCLLVLIYSCKKNEVQQTEDTITGRAFYKNKFAADSSKLQPLSFETVYIRHTGKPATEYYQALKTDKDGNFYIEKMDFPSVVYAMPRLGLGVEDTVILSDSIILEQKPSAPLRLVATLNASTTGVYLHSLDPTGTTLPGTTIYIYKNLAFATQGGNAGATYTLTTDTDGKAFKTGIPAGTYYLNASKEVDALAFLRNLKTLIVKPVGITADTVILGQKGPEFQNGFELTVVDTMGSHIPGALVKIYTSLVLANINDTAGTIFILTADAQGKVVKQDILPDTYYANAYIQADTLILSRIAKSIPVTNSGIFADTIIVK